MILKILNLFFKLSCELTPENKPWEPSILKTWRGGPGNINKPRFYVAYKLFLKARPLRAKD